MSVRPLVAYDDITLPYESPNPPPTPHKKRKRNNNNNNNNNNRKKNKHRDDPRTVMEQELEEEEDEESRELTHEEIWDDSALVNAWNSAMEEYEAYHGPDKPWKNEPIHKSPLWYNTPSMNPPKHTTDNMQVDQHQEYEQDENSKPLNFDTFIPTHDPTLTPPTTTTTTSSAAITTTTHSQVPTLENPSDLSTISQDEAFNRALQASYWFGYWTAIYHSHRQQPLQPTQPQSQSQSEPEQQLNVQPQPQTLTQNSTTTSTSTRHPTTDQDQKDNNNDIQSQSQTELDNIDSSSSDNDNDDNDDDDEEGEEFVSTQR